jgi:predicted CopG family antitoxin
MFSLESLVAMIFDVYKQLSRMKISVQNVAKTKADEEHFSDVLEL